MIKVHENLYVGKIDDCYSNSKEMVIVHACKSPCHQIAVGYRGNLNANHPNYLILEKERDLFLNMVDMEAPLLPLYTDPIIKAMFKFIDKNIKENKILIHCNQGLSRAPSLAMVYLVKRKKVISNNSYEEAEKDFKKIFPHYNPNRGIKSYLIKNWEKINYLIDDKV